MRPKLIRSLLSTRPALSGSVMAWLGFLVLAVFFAIDQRDWLGLSSGLSASSEQVFARHELWRLFTATLIHADLGHLISNAIFFVVFAYLLNGYFGFWAFPAVSFLAGGVINALTLSLYPEQVTILGASGVVYFMVAFWLTLYFWIERGMPPLRRATNALAFALMLFFPESFDQHVSYLAHTIGFVLGLPAGTLFFFARREQIRAFEVWQWPEIRLELPEPLHDAHSVDARSQGDLTSLSATIQPAESDSA